MASHKAKKSNQSNQDRGRGKSHPPRQNNSVMEFGRASQLSHASAAANQTSAKQQTESPSSMKSEQAKNIFTKSASEMGRVLKNNPWPYAMIGAAGAWIAVDQVRSRRHADSSGEASHANGVSNGHQRGGESRVGKALRSMGGSTAHVAEEGVQRIRELGSTIGHGASKIGRSAQRAFERNPLLGAAMTLGLGFGLGWLLPVTAVENRMFGRAKNQLSNRIGTAWQGAKDTAKDAAKGAGSALKAITA